MVYKENIVVCIKCGGKILREKGEYVNLPFNSEYSILLKNLDSRKAVVSIDIDGEDVLDGDRLIVEPNSDIELEGFKKGNKVTNRFKFIKKTDKISEYRGDKVDDGFIRVGVTYEEVEANWWYPCYTTYNWWYPYISYSVLHSEPWNDHIYISDGTTGSAYLSNCVQQCSLTSNGRSEYKTRSVEFSNNLNNPEDLGITVKGSNDSGQKFQKGYIKRLESNSSVIVIRLRGISQNKEIKRPLFVSSKLECEVCGMISESHANFCRGCGNCLKIV